MLQAALLYSEWCHSWNRYGAFNFPFEGLSLCTCRSPQFTRRSNKLRYTPLVMNEPTEQRVDIENVGSPSTKNTLKGQTYINIKTWYRKYIRAVNYTTTTLIAVVYDRKQEKIRYCLIQKLGEMRCFIIVVLQQVLKIKISSLKSFNYYV